METNSQGHAILALSDGRAGNVAMALGLAEAVAAQTGLSAMRHDLSPGGVVVGMPPGLWPRLPAGRVLGFAPSLAEFSPRLVIGAGRRVAPFVEALRRARGIKAVQILDSGIAPRRFDLVVAPSHDRLKGSNILATLGSVHRVTRAKTDAAAAEWRGRFDTVAQGRSGPRIAVLVGGNSGKHRFETGFREPLLEGLERLLATDATLLMTASRRTSATLTTALWRLAERPGCWLWDGDGENPYFGLLGGADAIIATPDSVNMLSEAASLGKPLYIPGDTKMSFKHGVFIDELVDRDVAIIDLPEILRSDWHPEPLHETERAAAAVAALLTEA